MGKGRSGNRTTALLFVIAIAVTLYAHFFESRRHVWSGAAEAFGAVSPAKASGSTAAGPKRAMASATRRRSVAADCAARAAGAGRGRAGCAKSTSSRAGRPAVALSTRGSSKNSLERRRCVHSWPTPAAIPRN